MVPAHFRLRSSSESCYLKPLMPYELFLALRYLYARRRKALARVTALFAVAGVAFGVAAFIVALALSRGFADEMRDKILSSTAHITLMRSERSPIAALVTEMLEEISPEALP